MIRVAGTRRQRDKISDREMEKAVFFVCKDEVICLSDLLLCFLLTENSDLTCYTDRLCHRWNTYIYQLIKSLISNFCIKW